ncbi:MAG TPA: hypothetical protein VFU36_16675 [Jatrophihabitans sp.]|nr:hypothetical protein [Jatrophihabitans sp.]
MPSTSSTSAVRLTARQRPLRAARTCYDHLAGVLGVAVTEALVSRQALLIDEGGFQLGPAAEPTFGSLGLELPGQLTRRASRPLLRSCLDWTEKRPHLAGRLGAAVAAAMLQAGWLVRPATDRSVAVTDLGRQRLANTLGLELPAAVLRRELTSR